MKILLYIIAAILIIGWIIGFFIYAVGSLIHLLLVFAIIAIVLSLVKRKVT